MASHAISLKGDGVLCDLHDYLTEVPFRQQSLSDLNTNWTDIVRRYWQPHSGLLFEYHSNRQSENATDNQNKMNTNHNVGGQVLLLSKAKQVGLAHIFQNILEHVWLLLNYIR